MTTTKKAAAIRAFYDEYCAVMDLAVEFYLETVRTVFQEHSLPIGRFEWRGRRIDAGAIRRTAFFTVEGKREIISAASARHWRPYIKRNHLQTGVGHYGVFAGRRWSCYIYPIIYTS